MEHGRSRFANSATLSPSKLSGLRRCHSKNTAPRASKAKCIAIDTFAEKREGPSGPRDLLRHAYALVRGVSTLVGHLGVDHRGGDAAVPELVLHVR